MNKVVVWGDSIARGVVYNDEKNKYCIAAESAVKIVAQKLGLEIVNRARMGMTAEGGLEQIKGDISRGIVPKVAFVEFGGNDSDFDWKAINDEPDAEHLPKTPMPAYERTMRKIIETLKSHGTHVILATLPPIISERYFDFLVKKNGLRDENVLHWLGDKNHIYRFQERYSMKISEIAHECGCKLIDLREAFLDKWNTTTYYCSDGIHPNEKGQQLIGDTALAAL